MSISNCLWNPFLHKARYNLLQGVSQFNSTMQAKHQSLSCTSNTSHSLLSSVFFFSLETLFLLLFSNKVIKCNQASNDSLGTETAVIKMSFWGLIFSLPTLHTGLAVTRRFLQPDEAFSCCVAPGGQALATEAHGWSGFDIYAILILNILFLIMTAAEKREVKNNKGLPSLVFQQLFLLSWRFALNLTGHCYQSCLLPNLSTRLMIPHWKTAPLLCIWEHKKWAEAAQRLRLHMENPSRQHNTWAGLPREPLESLPGKVFKVTNIWQRWSRYIWAHPKPEHLSCPILQRFLCLMNFQILAPVPCADRTLFPNHCILLLIHQTVKSLPTIRPQQVQRILYMSKVSCNSCRSQGFFFLKITPDFCLHLLLKVSKYTPYIYYSGRDQYTLEKHEFLKSNTRKNGISWAPLCYLLMLILNYYNFYIV